MLHTPFLARMTLAKSLGLGLGLLGVLLVPTETTAQTMLLWGIAGWYLMLGAMVGLVGFVNRLPILDLPVPAFLRGAWCGGWMGLLLVLVAHDGIAGLWAQLSWVPRVFASPWWLIVEMAFWGAVIDMLATSLLGPLRWTRSGVSDADHRAQPG